MRFILVIILLTLFIVPTVSAKPFEQKLSCPCKELYSVQKAKIAFMGTLKSIEEKNEECPGFECRVMDITFKIDEPWKGVPVSGYITFKTDDTSCGYGHQLSPPGKRPKLGEPFAIFAEEGGVGICNSIIMHKSLLHRTRAKQLHLDANR